MPGENKSNRSGKGSYLFPPILKPRHLGKGSYPFRTDFLGFRARMLGTRREGSSEERRKPGQGHGCRPPRLKPPTGTVTGCRPLTSTPSQGSQLFAGRSWLIAGSEKPMLTGFVSRPVHSGIIGGPSSPRLTAARRSGAQTPTTPPADLRRPVCLQLTAAGCRASRGPRSTPGRSATCSGSGTSPSQTRPSPATTAGPPTPGSNR